MEIKKIHQEYPARRNADRRDYDVAQRRDHGGVDKLSAGDKQLLQRYRQGELRHVLKKVFVVHFLFLQSNSNIILFHSGAKVNDNIKHL